MFNPNALLKLIKPDLPGASDKEIVVGIKDFQKQYPNATLVQALAIFNTAMRHPKVKEALSNSKSDSDVTNYIKTKGQSNNVK